MTIDRCTCGHMIIAHFSKIRGCRVASCNCRQVVLAEIDAADVQSPPVNSEALRQAAEAGAELVEVGTELLLIEQNQAEEVTAHVEESAVPDSKADGRLSSSPKRTRRTASKPKSSRKGSGEVF